MGNVLSLFFFEIDKTKGDIRIRRPLTLDKARPNQYDVSAFCHFVTEHLDFIISI